MGGVENLMSWDGAIISIVAILAGALFLLFFRYIWRPLLRFVVRAGAFIRRVFAPVTRVLKTLFRAIGLRGRRGRPMDAVLSVGVGSVATVLTEIERELSEGEEIESARRNRGLLFYSARLEDPEFEAYDEEKALRDFELTKEFFGREVRTDANSLNLYDDIYGGVIVKNVGKSDRVCLYRLFELRSLVTWNAYILYLTLATMISLLIALNATASQSIDFYNSFSLAGNESVAPVLSFFASPGHEATFFNATLFAFLSSFVTLVLMTVLSMFYEQKQDVNGQTLDHYLSQYLTQINNRFLAVKAKVQAAIGRRQDRSSASDGDDADIESTAENGSSAKSRSVLWIENLHWMAFRAYLIQNFFAIMAFQMRRNISLAAFFVPLFFILLGVSLNVFWGVDFIWSGSDVSAAPYFFIALLILLLVWVYNRFASAYDPIRRQVRPNWDYFKRLDVVGSMNEVMLFYEDQLRLARERYGGRQGD